MIAPKSLLWRGTHHREWMSPTSKEIQGSEKHPYASNGHYTLFPFCYCLWKNYCGERKGLLVLRYSDESVCTELSRASRVGE